MFSQNIYSFQSRETIESYIRYSISNPFSELEECKNPTILFKSAYPWGIAEKKTHLHKQNIAASVSSCMDDERLFAYVATSTRFQINQIAFQHFKLVQQHVHFRAMGETDVGFAQQATDLQKAITVIMNELY